MTAEEIDNLKFETLQVELEFKKIELLSKKKELNKKNHSLKSITIEQATILVAIIGFIGSFLGSFLQGFFAQQQKQQEFEASLITKAVESGNSKQSKDNLKFLLDAGLINDSKNKIQKILVDTGYKINFTPAQSYSDSVQKTELENYIAEISKIIGISPKFILRPTSEGSSVYAIIDSGQQVLMYNPKFIEEIRGKTKTNWSILMVLAHECSHHLLGHMNKSTEQAQHRQFELEADQWAGFVLAKMGATLDEAQSVLKSLDISEAETDYFPSKTARLIAVKKGWENAKS